MPLLAGVGVHEAGGIALRIAALQHVEVLGSVEGKAVVELSLHQIHEGAAGEGSVVAIDHGGEFALGGVDLHRGPAQQPGQGVERGRDCEGEVAHQQ